MTRFRTLKQGEIGSLGAFLESCGDFATVSPHCGEMVFVSGGVVGDREITCRRRGNDLTSCPIIRLFSRQ
jgi:hypothetical protein